VYFTAYKSHPFKKTSIMKNLVLSLLLILILPLSLAAQRELPPKIAGLNVIPLCRNEVGIEIGGLGLLYNIFYQQRIARLGSNTTLNLRLGGAALPLFVVSDTKPAWGYNLNIMPTILFYKKRHAWETGIAMNFFDYTEHDAEYMYNGSKTKANMINRFLLLAPQGSYRYYFKKSPFYLRGTLLVHIGLTQWDRGGARNFESPRILPWAGVSGGITF
jgi:hypothetical protein